LFSKNPAAFAGTLMENELRLFYPGSALELKVKYDVSEDGGPFPEIHWIRFRRV
jgi:hypothetical protein